MALLRLSALAIAACGQAGAQAPAATSGLAAPPGWRALPEIALAASDAAKADGVTVAGSEAWGEPARGCYAVWLQLTGSGATAEHVVAGLAGEQLATQDLVRPEGAHGIVSLAFAKPPYTGRLRAIVADRSVTALACFANEREPRACETACTSFLGALK